jgi:hypothetical protein
VASLPFPEFQVYNDETELVYEDEYEDEGPPETFNFDKVAIPRWILYAQGVLLGVMAMVGFAFGVMVGGVAPRDGPEAARPEQKAAVASFRPGASPVDAANPAIIAIREIGGDFTRADSQGRFRLVAPGPGDYFLLIISAHLQRPPEQRAAPQDLAELGRYVESAPELLDQNRYQWTRRRLEEDEVLSHVFR